MVYEDVHQYGGHVCVNNVDEKLFSKYRLNAAMHRQRMAELAKLRKDFRTEILIEEGDHNFAASGYADYRWIPKSYFSRAVFYIFGPYLVLISFDHQPPPPNILIKSAAFADAYRHAFDIRWSNAVKPPTQKGKSAKRGR